MKIVLFCHSLLSCWNHGNAHFLRGIANELIARGHDVQVYEQRHAWSLENLIADYGEQQIAEIHYAYPTLSSHRYDPATLDLDAALDGADIVLVHEWNEHDLVRRIGEHRAARRSYRLFFHDTHHRAVTAPETMSAYDLSHYDGVLAYGKVLRDIYIERGWNARAWVWHEAADTRVFYPRQSEQRDGDVVWIGNWGDDERAGELREFLIEAVRDVGLRASVFGVRYPQDVRELLSSVGISYGGYLPNFRVPEIYARFKVTVHVPRRPYVAALPGIPTIRPFEALACGIPLVCSPWNDAEGLLAPGKDFLVARNGSEMKKHLRALLADKSMARELVEHGLRTIRARHTCEHRVNELLQIFAEVNA